MVVLDIIILIVNAVLIFAFSTATAVRRYKKGLEVSTHVSYLINDLTLVGNALVLVCASWLIQRSIRKQAGGMETKATLIKIHFFNSIVYAILITINNVLERKEIVIIERGREGDGVFYKAGYEY